MSWDFFSSLLLFFVVSLGLAWPMVARLEFDGPEKIVASTALSLCGVFLLAWTVFIFALPESALWVLPALAVGGMLFRRSALAKTLGDPEARRLLVTQAIVTAWCLGWLALVGSYSGGGWAADWFEHWERTRWFLDHGAKDVLFLGHYPVTARPPLANAVTAAFLRLSRDDFAHYQIVTTLFGSLTFLPAALLARRCGGGDRAFALLAVLFMVNPLFVQNATFAWTKLPAAFFVLAAIYFFWRTLEATAPRSTTPLCVACLAAGVLAHYSAAPYAVILAVAWPIAGWSRRHEARWRRDTTLAVLTAAALLATWFGWSLASYGVRHTLLANSSVRGAAANDGSQLAIIALNLRDTLVPHFLRPIDGTLIAQTSAWGRWRDWWFQLYQLNLFFACGTVAWIAILVALWRVGREAPARKRVFVGALVGGVVVLGVAVNGPRDTWGLAHICLQPLVLLGLAFLAGRWEGLSCAWRRALIAGGAIDLCLGIVLHFALQNRAITLGLNPGQTNFGWAASYNESAGMNLSAKLSHGLEFFGDVLPAATAILFALLGALLVWALVRALPRETTRRPGGG